MSDSRRSVSSAIPAQGTLGGIGELWEAHAVCSACETLSVGLKIASELGQREPCPDGGCGGSLSWVANRRRLI